ncbi:Hypothetical protein CINCED_3A007719 [Cinara cedri]|uniref:Uncharacterized protein n=1 Tax=Cinara cedri TaxID=506608 RepID=A0A5E4MW46_9HEMI|nr:Hypothetical protein CINCED_3A007719 [Cinara cedri]
MAKLEIRNSENSSCFDQVIDNITLIDGEGNQYSIYVNGYDDSLGLWYMQSQGHTEGYKITGLNDLIRDFFNFSISEGSQLSETFARVDGNNISKDSGIVNKLMSHYTSQAHDFFTGVEKQYNAMSDD